MIGLAAMTALSPAKAPFTALMAPATFGTIVIIVPTAEMIFPTMIRTGPIAAATSAMVTMTFFVPSSMLLSLSTNP